MWGPRVMTCTSLTFTISESLSCWHLLHYVTHPRTCHMAGHCNLNIKLKKALSITVPTCSSNMALLQHPAQKFCCNKPIFVLTNICRDKINVCCDKIFVTQAYFYCDKCGYAKICLSWQKFCHDKIIVSTFVATKIFCCDKHNFVATKVLSQQMFCCGRDTLVETKEVFCHDKSMLVATELLSWQTCVCQDKIFVATKMILVAALTNDMGLPGTKVSSLYGTEAANTLTCRSV